MVGRNSEQTTQSQENKTRLRGAPAFWSRWNRLCAYRNDDADCEMTVAGSWLGSPTSMHRLNALYR